jgi:hypothetical protein
MRLHSSLRILELQKLIQEAAELLKVLRSHQATEICPNDLPRLLMSLVKVTHSQTSVRIAVCADHADSNTPKMIDPRSARVGPKAVPCSALGGCTLDLPQFWNQVPRSIALHDISVHTSG